MATMRVGHMSRARWPTAGRLRARAGSSIRAGPWHRRLGDPPVPRDSHDSPMPPVIADPAAPRSAKMGAVDYGLIGIVGGAVPTGAGGAAGSWVAQALLPASALCFSLANIYTRRLLAGYHPFVVASLQTIGSLALSVPLALLIESPWGLPNPAGHVGLAMVVMGLVGSGLAPLGHFTVLKRVFPVNATLASIVVPVTPVLMGGISRRAIEAARADRLSDHRLRPDHHRRTPAPLGAIPFARLRP